MMMRVLRVLATTAAGVWLGGMVLIAIVAQTTFSQMREVGVEHPNAIAGRIMAVNFSRFDVMQLACAGVLVVWQSARLLSGWRGLGDWLRAAAILSAVGLLGYSTQVLTPRILGLQGAVAGPDSEAEAKSVFDDFHHSAVRVSKANLVLVAGITFSLAWPHGVGQRTKESEAIMPAGKDEGTS